MQATHQVTQRIFKRKPQIKGKTRRKQLMISVKLKI